MEEPYAFACDLAAGWSVSCSRRSLAKAAWYSGALYAGVVQYFYSGSYHLHLARAYTVRCGDRYQLRDSRGRVLMPPASEEHVHAATRYYSEDEDERELFCPPVAILRAFGPCPRPVAPWYRPPSNSVTDIDEVD